MQDSVPIFILGDIHGQFRSLHKLLEHEKLIDHHQHWIGGTKTLWLMGDLVDRGHESVGVLDFVMRLQGEAGAAGGSVGCLIGNHEVLLLGLC